MGETEREKFERIMAVNAERARLNTLRAIVRGAENILENYQDGGSWEEVLEEFEDFKTDVEGYYSRRIKRHIA